MKYLFLFFILISLSACGISDFYNLIGHRRFKIGDCLIQSLHEPESWETTKPQFKVITLGKKAYLILNINYRYEDKVTYGHLWEDFYQKVPCGDINE